MPSLLKLKHHLIGTAAAKPLNRVRWATSLPMRLRHPELHGVFHESEFIERAVQRLVTPTMNCIDGGCHIGAMLARFVELAPQGQHIAFEPVAEKAGWLRRRWPQAEVHQAAIGERVGQATFNQNKKHPGMSSLRRENIEGDGISSYTVDIVTVDDIVGDREIGFFKLDVEGNELFALRGARKVLTTSKPALLFECGPPWTLTPFDYTRGDLWDFLYDDVGYSVWLVADYLFSREPMGRAEFERAGTYPFPGFNYIALPIGTELTPIDQLDRSK